MDTDGSAIGGASASLGEATEVGARSGIGVRKAAILWRSDPEQLFLVEHRLPTTSEPELQLVQEVLVEVSRRFHRSRRAFGITLILLGVLVVWTAWLPRPLGYLFGVGGIAYLVVGWILSVDGFAPAGAIPTNIAQASQPESAGPSGNQRHLDRLAAIGDEVETVLEVGQR